MKKYPIKTEYYESYDCDFAGAGLAEKQLPDGYRYVRHGAIHSVLHFAAYRLFATPLAALYKIFVGRERVVGKEKLKLEKNTGFFIYGNHTAGAADAFIPNLTVFPRRGYTVVSPSNFSMPVLGRGLYYLGALPVPKTIRAAKELRFAIDERISEGGAIIIYPEAHLWKYDVSIRPFGDESFSHPTRLGAPCFAMTRVYKRRGNGYRTEVYVDGPYYPDPALSTKDARAALCSTVRSAMEERAKLSDIEIIRYEKVKN